MTHTHRGHITHINERTMEVRLNRGFPIQFCLDLFTVVRPTIAVGDYVEIETKANNQAKNLVMKERANN